MTKTRTIWLLAAVFLAGLGLALAQAPTGTIAGTVTDESGAGVPDAQVRIASKATGAQRLVSSGLDGYYSAALLPPGDYEIRAEAKGFRALVREATVETGSTTTADLNMKVGAVTEAVTVAAAAAQISYDSHRIDGVVTRRQIDSLPLNGRSFLNLAALEPGVTVTTATLAQYNAQFQVFVMGGSNARTSINADGGNVRDRTTGNTSQNFSQEVVQEFQISTANFDLSTGITSVGSINIVTRSGTQDHHGAGYFSFRDHNLAAYPALRRNTFNPDPFFARRSSGFWLGGPVKKDRLFFFFNLEHMNQDAVTTVQPNAASLASLALIGTSPYTTKQISNRFDYTINSKHTVFARYSHDGNRGAGPQGGPTMPSNWLVNDNWSDQSILGFSSVLRPNLVNDFRFSYSWWKNRNQHPAAADCPNCLGFDFPEVAVSGTNFVLGHTQNAPQGRDYRTFQWRDNMNWQRRSHRFQFGGEWEMDITKGFWGYSDPASMVVYPPEVTRQRTPGIAVPPVIRTIDDFLQLPVLSLNVGFGDPTSPAPFQQKNATHNHRFRAFWQDSWRLHPRFTLNYGAAWQAETTLGNHDLAKAPFLAPILGGGSNLQPTRRDWNNVSPSLGFAWNLGGNNKTVIRAGSGIYYDTQLLWERLNERQLLGPRGNGRQNVSGGFIPNMIEGIPGVPVGRVLDFTTNPTEFRLGHFLQMIPQLQGFLGPRFTPNFNDLSVRGVNVTKSVTGLTTVFPTDFPIMYAMHMNVGVQREIRSGLVATVDFVSRQFRKENFGLGLDHNHWNSVRGPVIPACVGAQRDDPAASCSTNIIQVRTPGSRTNYRGLLAKLDKRFSSRWQLTGSYAWQARYGVNGNTNKDNWFATWGPQGLSHNFSLAGIVELPLKFQVSFISAIASRLPVMPTITSIDLDGDGSTNEPLPGVPHNGFNRGLGKTDLDRAVGEFNQKYAGTRTPRNQLVPTLRLPEAYEFGDTSISQDIRVTKLFPIRERFEMRIYAEAFNLFNVANLGGYGFSITDATSFGQPTSRANQIFGSGGPRAFQFGARVSF